MFAVGPGRCTGLGRARVAQLEAGAQATAINEALQQHRPDAILVHQVSDTEQVAAAAVGQGMLLASQLSTLLMVLCHTDSDCQIWTSWCGWIQVHQQQC